MVPTKQLIHLNGFDQEESDNLRNRVSDVSHNDFKV